jgi:hypothetical protein
MRRGRYCFIPAAILIVWALLDWWLIKDTPEEASLPNFDTHDASSGLSWYWWLIFLMPFALLGSIIAIKIWNELPTATRKYIADVELEGAPQPEPELVS